MAHLIEYLGNVQALQSSHIKPFSTMMDVFTFLEIPSKPEVKSFISWILDKKKSGVSVTEKLKTGKIWKNKRVTQTFCFAGDAASHLPRSSLAHKQGMFFHFSRGWGTKKSLPQSSHPQRLDYSWPSCFLVLDRLLFSHEPSSNYHCHTNFTRISSLACVRT